MTEADAKTKWCPFAMSIEWDSFGPEQIEKPVSANRHNEGSIHKATMCLASECMAWRADRAFSTKNIYGGKQEQKTGYCGLAGKP
jgi:hypothetical protein